MHEIHRIVNPEYLPTFKDIRNCRAGHPGLSESLTFTEEYHECVSTAALSLFHFFFKKIPILRSISIFDITNQQFGCGKWPQRISSLPWFIFCASLLDYDQVVEGDDVDATQVNLDLFDHLKLLIYRLFRPF
jgi:hypothetical protein